MIYAVFLLHCDNNLYMASIYEAYESRSEIPGPGIKGSCLILCAIKPTVSQYETLMSYQSQH